MFEAQQITKGFMINGLSLNICHKIFLKVYEYIANLMTLILMMKK